MKHIYSIFGMTCNGCRIGVEERLNSVPGVIHAAVDLEKAVVEIEMKDRISTAAFQNVLGEKYKIHDKADVVSEAVDEARSDWHQLFPLFLIFGYLTIASLLLNRNQWAWHGFMLDFMGLFYIVFSFFKMLDLRGFRNSFRMYDPLAKKIAWYALVYPFIETALGLCLLLRFEIDLMLFATIIVLGITTIGVVKVLLDKQTIQCACLGTTLKLPMTKATFIENTVMIVMATAMLFAAF